MNASSWHGLGGSGRGYGGVYTLELYCRCDIDSDSGRGSVER